MTSTLSDIELKEYWKKEDAKLPESPLSALDFARSSLPPAKEYEQGKISSQTEYYSDDKGNYSQKSLTLMSRQDPEDGRDLSMLVEIFRENKKTPHAHGILFKDQKTVEEYRLENCPGYLVPDQFATYINNAMLDFVFSEDPSSTLAQFREFNTSKPVKSLAKFMDTFYGTSGVSKRNKHGGTIEVFSEKDGGLRVNFISPRNEGYFINYLIPAENVKNWSARSMLTAIDGLLSENARSQQNCIELLRNLKGRATQGTSRQSDEILDNFVKQASQLGHYGSIGMHPSEINSERCLTRIVGILEGANFALIHRYDNKPPSCFNTAEIQTYADGRLTLKFENAYGCSMVFDKPLDEKSSDISQRIMNYFYIAESLRDFTQTWRSHLRPNFDGLNLANPENIKLIYQLDSLQGLGCLPYTLKNILSGPDSKLSYPTLTVPVPVRLKSDIILTVKISPNGVQSITIEPPEGSLMSKLPILFKKEFIFPNIPVHKIQETFKIINSPGICRSYPYVYYKLHQLQVSASL